MKQNYVIYKGEKYNSGDVMQIVWYTQGCKKAHNYTGVFLDCDEDKDEYRFIVDGQTYCFNKTCFCKIIKSHSSSEEKNDCAEKNEKQTKFFDELNIDGMLIAWIWYIFIMVIASIFYARIGIWTLASVVFFKYRNKKIKKGGS